ncbi:MAG: DNA polymerase III subunit beta [Microgenomates group bacterium]
MKVSLLQENLNPALSMVSRFVALRAQLPILSSILFSSDNGRIRLSATNLEMGINYWIGGKIDIDGSFAVPSKEITEFISYLPAGKLDLSLNPQSLLEVSSSKATSTFTTSSPTDFPLIPSINPDTSLQISFKTFSSAISEVAFAASTDDSRPVLTAVLCIFTSTTFKLVATDGFRLSVKEIALDEPISLPSGTENLTFLIPSKSLYEVGKITKNIDKIKFGLSSDTHQLVFVTPDIELTSRLIEGEFPDYNRIIPTSFSTVINLSKEELSQSIKIASVFARESANVVKLSIKNNSLEVSANAVQVGQNKVTLDAKTDGEPLEIAFNYKYISDFLSVCQGENITISLNEALTPGLFQDSSNPTLTHIIMPVRIQD